jgi:hypothetical protein
MSAHAIPGFKPSTSALAFENRFAEAPVITVEFPILGERGFGDASGGLCGGMVFCVRDYHEADRVPPTLREPPSPGSALFDYLCRRLFSSFNLPLGVLKYYRWMQFPDTDHLVRGVWSRTAKEEWPLIKRELDNDHLAPLGLVTVRSSNPADLGQCHQVLAYAYEWNVDGSLRISVYDPNWPGRDDLVLTMNTKHLDQPITYSTGEPVRGFFLTQFHPPDEPLP